MDRDLHDVFVFGHKGSFVQCRFYFFKQSLEEHEFCQEREFCRIVLNRDIQKLKPNSECFLWALLDYIMVHTTDW